MDEDVAVNEKTEGMPENESYHYGKNFMNYEELFREYTALRADYDLLLIEHKQLMAETERLKALAGERVKSDV